MYPCPRCGWPKVNREDPACVLCMQNDLEDTAPELGAEDDDKEVQKRMEYRS
jgi:hypothetical protein